MKGMETFSQPSIWMFPWPVELVIVMIKHAAHAMCDLEVASWIVMLFYGMARQSHLQTVLLADVHNPCERRSILESSEEYQAFDGLHCVPCRD